MEGKVGKQTIDYPTVVVPVAVNYIEASYDLLSAFDFVYFPQVLLLPPSVLCSSGKYPLPVAVETLGNEGEGRYFIYVDYCKDILT